MADLEFIISLKDKVSAITDKVNASVNATKDKLNQATSAAEKLGPKINAAFSGVYNKAKSAVKGPEFLTHSVEDLRTKLEEVNKVRFNTVLASEFKSATREAKKLEKQISRIEQGISGSGIGSKIAGWRKDFANSMPGADLIRNPLTLAGAAIGGFWKTTEKAMQAGKEKIKLQTLTGSAEIGTALYDGLTKFATDTVFGDELYDMGAQMLANGISNTDVMPVMKELGDIAMGDADKLGSLSLAFAQINGKGKLAGQELLQLINAGFNPLQVISEKTGESMESLTTKMSKGQISVENVREAMQMATGPGGKFHNMLEKVADTPYGQLENLRGTLSQMMIEIGEVFLPIASKFMAFLSWIMEKAGPILKPLAAVLGIVATALIGVSVAQWAVNAAMLANPITWVIALVIGLIAVITWLISKVTGWGEQWDNVVSYVSDRWEMFKLSFTLIGQGIEHGFLTMVDGIVLAWKWGMNAIGVLSDEQYNKDVARIGAEGKAREDAIKETVLAGKKLANNMTDLQWKLGWDDSEENTLGNTQERLMNSISGGAGTLGKGQGAGEQKKRNTATATGGTKNTTINLTLKSLIEVLNIQKAGFKEGAKEMEKESADALLRALAMANLAAE